jgi:hypothetical protein
MAVADRGPAMWGPSRPAFAAVPDSVLSGRARLRHRLTTRPDEVLGQLTPLQVAARSHSFSGGTGVPTCWSKGATVNRRRGKRAIVMLAVVAGMAPITACEASTGSDDRGSATQSTASTASSPAPESTADNAKTGALAAYNGYWTVSDQADMDPGKQDWRPLLAEYTADPALSARLDTIKNYASVPAHFTGVRRRAPQVVSVTLTGEARVTIHDCLDVSDWQFVSKEGANVADPNQPKRFVFQADVVLYTNVTPNRWLVQKTAQQVEQPC